MIKLYAASIALTRIKLNLLLIVLTLLTINVFAGNEQHMIPVSLEERTRKSEVVVEGEVLSQKSFWNADHTNIYTSNTIKVYKVFKGTVQEKQLELITEGGSVGLTKHVLSTALELYNGQQGIFFLVNEKEVINTPNKLALSTRAYASQQGFVKYDLKDGSASDVFSTYSTVQKLYNAVTTHTGNNYSTTQENKTLTNALDAKQYNNQTQNTLLLPIITSFSPTVTSAGTGAILTINGNNFGTTRGSGQVEFRNSDDGGKTFMQPKTKDYISWTNTQIKVRIPSRGQSGGTAGSGEIRVVASDGTSIISATQLTIEFAYSNVTLTDSRIKAFEPLLQNKDGAGGYTVRFAPSMQSRSSAQEGFRRALNNWTCVTNINWRVGPPTTIEAANDDKVSVIRFAASSTFGQENVLASTLSRYEGFKCGNDTIFWLSEFDMAINNSINWQYGPGAPAANQFDFETVMLHELGHAHQLGHVILPRAVMHFAVASKDLVRDLSDADIRGGNLIMSRSVTQTACSSMQPMVRKTDGDCSLAPEIVSFDGTFQNKQVVLNWQTQKDQNVKSFIIQRSADGTNWTDLSTVNTKGPSTGQLSYTFTDTQPLPDVSYYRLKVVYTNNTFMFSPRVRVIDPGSLRVLRIYPNPISPNVHRINLLYLVQASSTLNVQLYNSTGKLVKDLAIPLSDINVPLEISLKDLAAGIYILKWQEKSNSGEFKIIRL